jgi:hypothetical protein
MEVKLVNGGFCWCFRRLAPLLSFRFYFLDLSHNFFMLVDINVRDARGFPQVFYVLLQLLILCGVRLKLSELLVFRVLLGTLIRIFEADLLRPFLLDLRNRVRFISRYFQRTFNRYRNVL